jgi:hypothetical protein
MSLPLDCLGLFQFVATTATTATTGALLWGTYLGWLARRALPTPTVGIGLSGGGLVGVIQHICAMEAMDQFSPSLTAAGPGLVISTISGGTLAHNVYANSPNLWVPSIDDFDNSTAAKLALLQPPEGRRGINAGGSLFNFTLLCYKSTIKSWLKY